jgi:peroxiredoxin
MLRKTTSRSINNLAAIVFAVAAALTSAASLAASWSEIAWSPAERPIQDKIGGLRNLPDKERGAAMRSLALQIRRLPATPNKLRVAIYLASLSTEGDSGTETLREVGTTLEVALREKSIPWTEPKDLPADPSSNERLPPYGYRELASLAQYEHVPVSLNDDVHYQDAITKLAAIDVRRGNADFTLTDLSGNAWTLSELRGKVVLVNFWATWCPPCRKEIPDLETLYGRFSSQGLVVLGISDEDVTKVEPFVRQHAILYPVLLDPKSTVTRLFELHGIPNTFLFDRSGRLVAEAIDMRTEKQFLAMLRTAGLQ